MTTKWKTAIVVMCTAGLLLFSQVSHADTASSLLQLLPKESILVGESSAKHPAEINTSRTALLTFTTSGHSYIAEAYVWRNQLGILIARPTKHWLTKL